MLVDACFERIVAAATAADDGADLAAGRREFERTTGPFDVADPWYEERIRLFLDWYVCDFRGASGRTPAERFAARAEHGDRLIAIALARSARSLYEATDEVSDDGSALVVRDRLGSGRFRVQRDPGGAAERLRAGDLFDGRLVAIDRRIHLTPGPLFHPRVAHAAIGEILDEASRRGARDRRLLDGLLRMRMRLDRFTAIRPQHIYRYDALGEEDVKSAPWAR